jgi:hypothetical protein
MTDVEAVVPPSLAIDCIARLAGLRAQPVFGEVGPAGGGAGFETSIPLTKYVGLFAERCGQKRSTGVASNRPTILAGPKVRIPLPPAVSQQTIGSSALDRSADSANDRSDSSRTTQDVAYLPAELEVRIHLPPAESRTKLLGCIGLVRVTGWLGSGVAGRLT